MKVKYFFDNEFKEFSIYDNVRSIPSIVDGLKVSQRKTIYGMLLRGENAGEMKVENAANWVASKTDYKHGATSLCTTLINLAQTFPGSNNINLFHPVGQFGSRLNPEAGAPRYIFTEMSEHFRKIFRKEDDIILQNIISDDEVIEPVHYYPILPMVLINGAKGTGTGYATTILCYNPNEVIKAVNDVLNKKTITKLIPWFNNFRGTVVKDANQVVIEGAYDIVDANTIRITELPVGTYQDDYKELLNDLEDAGFIKSYIDSSTEHSFDFLLNVPRTTTSMSREEFMKKFKLVSRVTETFSLWTETGKMKIFQSPEAIVEHFVAYRLAKYEDRRTTQIKLHKETIVQLEERSKFIDFYINNSQLFSKKTKAELQVLLEQNKFVNIDKLLQIRIYSLTKDEIDKLAKEIKKVQLEVKQLENSTALDIYKKELSTLQF